MKNISFDNPYLLLVAIPLVLMTLVPFFIAIRRDNKTKGVMASLALHLVIVFLVSCALAGLSYVSVITRTEVVVVADVSYSASHSLEDVDARISDIEDSLIGNSRMAVVVFGGEYRLHTEFDGEITSVKDHGIDTSMTDIASALDYAGTLFSARSIKRVVLITDARSTDNNGDARLLQSVDNLFAMDVQVDAIFLDSNLTEDSFEVQVSAVDYNKSTYRGHEATADVMITSSFEGRAIVTLFKGDEVAEVRTESLSRGFNILNFDLSTEEQGDFDYRVEVNAERDTTKENNSMTFTQSVSGELNVLLVTSKASDLDAARALYGEMALIDVYRVGAKNNPPLPYTVEQIIKYDEILLSDVDVRELPNYTAFISSVDTAVSRFGKSLVTFGNNNIQNKTDEVLTDLQNMLPVNFGNNDRDSKLMTLVIDCSRSMEFASKLIVTKQIASGIVELLDENDRVAIVAFWGDNYVALRPTPVSEKQHILEVIDSFDVYQGTMIGSAMENAYSMIKDLDYSDKQLVLISDGLSYTKDSEQDTAVLTARNMRASGIVVSSISVITREQSALDLMSAVAEAGQGKFYYIESESEFENKFSTEIADDITESVVEVQTPVKVARPTDSVLLGVKTVPDVLGFTYAKSKPNATTVLTMDYVKAGGGTVEVPLYAYWSYGNGRVSSFTSTLGGEWISLWQENDGKTVLSNLVKDAIPRQKIDYPFNLNVESDGSFVSVELIPATPKVDGAVTLTVTAPDGSTERIVLSSDGKKFFESFATPTPGRYDILAEYTYSNKSYTAKSTVNVSYSKEYDSFAAYSDTVLYKALRNRGEVVGADSIPEYSYDERELTTYVIHFTVPFLIAAAVLYVLDVIIRKLKLSDIIGLFKKVKKEGK